ncbi:MAG: DEAD/DEAH box helicase family protein [Eubacterium sp.]|nr:DEAD/DEAH box helicase family protein [Eubacterium sp.]
MQLTPEEIAEQQKNEENTKKKYITPIIQERWGKENPDNIIMEYSFTDGRVNIDGDKVSRGNKKKADYLLLFKDNLPLAIVEAKGIDHSAMEGYQQVLAYAEILDIPFAYATNGIDLIEEDLILHKNNDKLKMQDFPYPEELWGRYIEEKGLSEDEVRLINQPYYIDTSKMNPKKPRYYQRIAINRVIDAIAQGKSRMLLVMATGTGKTFTAFQIVWRLWKSKTKKKILYLVDRDDLAKQTLSKDFKPFVDRRIMIRMKNSSIKLDTAYGIFIALYQQLKNKDKNYYKELPPDFFDLIIVDECHRGSAALDSNWHEILEYFSSATQLGLTATPKETEDVSNINYFCAETEDKPLYTYSLKQGIEDGFLAPYRVISVELNIDKEGYRPPAGKLDVEGNPVEDRIYTQKDFDRTIVVEERQEIVARRITDYMKENNCRYAKTIVFCENIDHADAMVLKLKNLNADLVQENSKYIMKITGDDEIGKAEVENFTNPNVKYPVIAVTSKLLSTGVDSETCELIVLDKTIGSVTEFKQTIGRGTRIKENFTIDEEKRSKLHFTILDFRLNYHQFEDPKFDGEPVAVMEVGENGTFPKGSPQKETDSEDKEKDKTRGHIQKVRVNGVDVTIDGEEVRYTDENGNLVKQNIESCVKNNILSQYPSYQDFYASFKTSDDKDGMTTDLLIEETYVRKVRETVGYYIDKFDIVGLVGYKQPPKSKEERLQKVYDAGILDALTIEKRNIIQIILHEYKTEDFSKLKDITVFNLPVFKEKGYTPMKILKNVFGGNKQNYIDLMEQIEEVLY